MKTLLIILLVLFILYYVFKYAGRFLLSRMFKNFESKMNEDNIYSQKTEGEVTIQKSRNKNNKTKGIGEYVDFEEMKHSLPLKYTQRNDYRIESRKTEEGRRKL